MSKPNILISESDLHSFCSDWMIPLLSESFNVVWVEHSPTIDYKNTLVITRPFNTNNKWYLPFVEKGSKLVVDSLWDQPLYSSSFTSDNCLYVRNKNWIWYNHSLFYTELTYNQQNFLSKPHKHFLSLMNLIKPHREYLEKNLSDVLPNALYSYVGKGIRLPEDGVVNTGSWIQNLNLEWYTSTIFSIVAESTMHGLVYISEKTFKPIAFKHPFIIAGTPGLLKYLIDQGFETYDHIIDESYDAITDNQQRLEFVVNEVKRLVRDKELFNDTISKQKAEHNFNLFYNRNIVVNGIKNTIIKDLLEYAKT